MDLPTAQTLGICYGLSEVALGIFKRSGAPSQATDRSSLRLLWVVILASVAVAIFATRALPQFGSQLLASGYPLGLLVFLAGLALRWYAIVYLGRFFTVDVAIAEDHRVVDSGPYRESNWLPTPKGPFYLIFRNYAPDASVSVGLKDRATFQGPPGVMPVAAN